MQTIRRHWHISSEKYTGGDSLITALHTGWKIKRLIASEDFQRRGRYVTVHHLELERNGQITEMAVVNNPYVAAVMAELSLIKKSG